MSHSPVDTGSRNGQAVVKVPDPEVIVKAQRRRFTAEYKQRILQEADAGMQHGEISALLRREGLYSSHLNTWRQQRACGELQGLRPAKRGRKADPQAAEIVRLQTQLARAELIIDVQKKVSQLLGLPERPSAELK